MSKPLESRRWHPGQPRSCFSANGVKKKQYPTAAHAAAHCFSTRRYIYQCPDGNHWHIATYKEKK